MIKLDLNTKILDDGHNLSVLRPGHYYKLYSSFVKSSLVAIELPSLGLERGIPVSRHAKIDLMITRSIHFRKWYISRDKVAKKPPAELSEYSGKSSSRGLPQLHFALKTLFDGLSPGDLVVIPPRKFEDVAFIGEFTTEGTDYEQLYVPELYDRAPLIARKVRWLETIPKWKLPARILDALQKPQIILLVPRGSRETIYSVAYGDYKNSRQYTSRIEVAGREFSPQDDIRIQSFLNFIAVNLAKKTNNEQPVSFREAAFVEIPEEFNISIKANINSPGMFEITSRSILPLVIVAMLSLALEIGESAITNTEHSNLPISVTNRNGEDACSIEVKQEIKSFMNFMGANRWAEACEQMRKVNLRTGLTTNSRVSTSNNE